MDELLTAGPAAPAAKSRIGRILAFAFSLGGGFVLFVSTFAPALLGYLLYLGARLMGLTCKSITAIRPGGSPWTSVVMLAFVHISLGFGLVALFYPLNLMLGASWMGAERGRPALWGCFYRMLLPHAGALVLALAPLPWPALWCCAGTWRQRGNRPCRNCA